jgi:hypothetical protein
LSKKNHGGHWERGEKKEKALWKKGSAYLTTKLIPVVPVIHVIPASSEIN